MSCVNAWRLRNQRRGYQEPFLLFLRELVTEMLNTHGTIKVGTVAAIPPAIVESRFDRFNHWLIDIPKVNGKKASVNCRLCYRKPSNTPQYTNPAKMKATSSKAGFKCSKCNVYLHAKCFFPYHHWFLISGCHKNTLLATLHCTLNTFFCLHCWLQLCFLVPANGFKPFCL